MQRKQIMLRYDPWIIACVSSLLILGLLMVASASMVISDRQFGYPFHYFFRQSAYLVLGLLTAAVVTQIPIKIWEKYSGYLFIFSLLLLMIVLLPGIGKVVNGSRRWIQFGFLSVQVSELAKFSAIFYLASYLVRYEDEVHQQLKGFIKPITVVTGLSMLLLLEPDFGAAFVVTMTYLALLFLAGVRLRPFVVLLVLVVLALTLLVIFSPYRLQRLTAFINPWNNQFGSGYQLTQSLIAFGRGGFFGVGLGNSVQKLFYLPEAHTDFLFAVLAEELGLVGELLLIVLFFLLIGRIIFIGQGAEKNNRLFSAYIAYGTALWLSLQALINIGVSIGMLPTKGLTLPFVSYGGSSILVNCLVVGVILRIAFETEENSGIKCTSSRVTKTVRTC